MSLCRNRHLLTKKVKLVLMGPIEKGAQPVEIRTKLVVMSHGNIVHPEVAVPMEKITKRQW